MHTDLIQIALSTNARPAIGPTQDFVELGFKARIDTPGTSRGIWRWRVNEAQLSDEVRENIATTLSTSGRDRTDFLA